MKQKIITLLNQLNHGLVEREETLKTALLTVLAGENIVLIGPPGTGKSMLARRIADGLAVDKGEYFEYLLTKFSTPEEIFGPLSITELKQDRFKRNTAGYLPTVKMAFLDEIFKASSSILNALLTILNERVYHNGAEPQRVPLRGLIAASNELPTDQEELSALYDRFLVRGFVDYIKPENLKKMFEKTGDSPDLSKLTAADLDQIQLDTKSIDIPENVIDTILRIWEQHKETFKEDSRESLSDRRLKKVLHLLRVSAATNGRTEVDLSDVLLLKDCLWNHQDNAVKVRELIIKILQKNSASTFDCKTTPYAVLPNIAFSDVIEVKVPDIGGHENVDVIEVFVKVGDTIKKDQSLIALETDKATMEVPSTHAGVITEIKIAVGDKTTEGNVILLLDISEKTSIPTALAQETSKRRTSVVKGFNGSGSQQDPLLIGDIHELMDLSRPDVGLQGYYFRQTTDIDCSELTSWPDIDFKGHYDGADFEIEGIPNRGFWLVSGANNGLFRLIKAESSISNLKLNNLRLANAVEDSQIARCISNLDLINTNATNCSITACKAGQSLILDSALKCVITGCQSGSVLIKETASYCQIRDCLVVINYQGSRDECCGGIAKTINHGSVIERCFVTGGCNYSGSGLFYFYGISETCDDSIIRGCTLGKLDRSSSDVRVSPRITSFSSEGLENNASIDSNEGANDRNGRDGATIAAALFKQRYFEHTLNWDFDTVWQWDDKENRPTLRAQRISTSNQANSAEQQVNMIDLLTQQIRANIWL